MTGDDDGPAGERTRGRRRQQWESAGVVPAWSLAAGLLPLVALVLEYAGSIVGSGPTSRYPGWLVTVAWPQPVRALWWLLAAGGTWAVTRGLARASGRSGWLVSILVTLPFVAFAVGILAATSWSAWH